MDDAGLVGDVRRAGQHGDEVAGLPRRLGGAVDSVRQAPALHELQGEERAAAFLADLMNLDDVGVPESGDGLGLGAEAAQLLRAGEIRGRDHLQGDEALQARLPRLVHHPHAAATQQAQDFVAGHRRQTRLPDSGPGGWRRRPGGGRVAHRRGRAARARAVAVGSGRGGGRRDGRSFREDSPDQADVIGEAPGVVVRGDALAAPPAVVDVQPEQLAQQFRPLRALCPGQELRQGGPLTLPPGALEARTDVVHPPQRRLREAVAHER